jgi:hypothetical protein
MTDIIGTISNFFIIFLIIVITGMSITIIHEKYEQNRG